MSQLLSNGLAMVEEDEATPEVARFYEEIKREMQLPFIPNSIKAAANSPAVLAIYWNLLRSFYSHTTLPQSLSSMILYTIAEQRNCRYCSATNELTCRTLGIDDQTLSALVKDLGNVSPERVQAIITFALKVALDPQGLEPDDYERVRNQGLSEAELVEVILIASIGNFNDTMADALKIEVDTPVRQALAQIR